MAVFPDRIILKNSTDPQATIETAIASGGTDEIQQGELVIGREAGKAKIYTVDSAGNIVIVGGAQSIDELTDVDTSTTGPVEGQALIWDNTGGQWVPGDVATSGGGGRGDGGDLDTGTVDSGYVFGVYGGGDLDTASADEPIDFLGSADGGDIT